MNLVLLRQTKQEVVNIAFQSKGAKRYIIHKAKTPAD